MRLLAARSLAYTNMEADYKAAGPLRLSLTSLVGAYGRQTCGSPAQSELSLMNKRKIEAGVSLLWLVFFVWCFSSESPRTSGSLCEEQTAARGRYSLGFHLIAAEYET